MSWFRANLGQPEFLVLIRQIFDKQVAEPGATVPDLGAHAAADANRLGTRTECATPSECSAEATLPAPVGGKKEHRDDDGAITHVASWLGYELHLLVDTRHEVPLAFEVTSADAPDHQHVATLVDQAQAALPAGRMKTMAYDKADGDRTQASARRGGGYTGSMAPVHRVPRAARSRAVSAPLAAFALVLVLALACSTPPPTRAPEPPSRPPNILLLLLDDLRHDVLGCAGDRIAVTPAIDALAARGVRFRNAFVTTSICAASRASIFTGLYERTHGYTFGTPPLTDEHLAASYPALLRRHGYRTGFVGKFGVAASAEARKFMFDEFVPLQWPYSKRQPDGSFRHLTDITGDRALGFLDGCSAATPWCLSISFHAPHAEDDKPRQYVWSAATDGLYADAVFPARGTMAPGFFAALPGFLRETESRKRFLWRFDEPEKRQQMLRGYYRMVADVDAVIGRIVQELTSRGLVENTVILFTSDNGYFLGERGFADKWYLYDPSVRVPLIVVDPRLPALRAGAVSDLMALNVDLAATIGELAGVREAPPTQGQSLVPLLHGRAPVAWRTDFFYEHLLEHPGIPKSEGVRDERWTYVRWFAQAPVVEELYDHLADPDEAHDLVADPEHAAVLARLRARCDELRDGVGGPFVPRRRAEKREDDQ
ncbi:MAG: sulfatase [Planctomycetes bacterium]|nr:sulfatase [Planctomycetota bacterium]